LARSVGGGCRKEEGADWRGVVWAVAGRRKVLIGEELFRRFQDGRF
jgi:hypothetical protein